MIFPRLPKKELKKFYDLYCTKHIQPIHPPKIQEIIKRIESLYLAGEIDYIDTEMDNVIVIRKRYSWKMSITERMMLPISYKHDKIILEQDGFKITRQGTGCGYTKKETDNWIKKKGKGGKREKGLPMGYAISIKIT